ncbi:MAG: MFS transporter [Tepidiformaceae bacterium]
MFSYWGQTGRVSLAIFMFWLSLYLYVPFLPIRASDLGASNTIIGLVVASYAIGQVLLRIPIGFGADLLGKRRPFALIAFIASVIGALGLALAPSPLMLFVARSITGVAAAGWVVISVLYVSYWDQARTSEAMSRVMAITTFSIVVATFLGGFLVEYFGVISTFYAGLITGCIGIVLFWFSPESQEKIDEGFDWKTAVNVARTPLLLKTSFLGILAQFVAFATTFTFIPIYAKSIDASDMENGYLAAAMFTFAGIGSLMVPFLMKKIEFSWLIVSAFLVIACSVVVVPFIESPIVLVMSQAFGGLGRGVLNVQLMTLAVLAVSISSRATSMGIYQAIYAIGMLLGPLVAGFVGDYVSIFWVFGLSTCISLISAFLTWLFLSKTNFDALFSNQVPQAKFNPQDTP